MSLELVSMLYDMFLTDLPELYCTVEFTTNILCFSGLPYGEPKCSAYATLNNEFLMLSCSWEGGLPRALLWWASSSGDMQETSEDKSNMLVLRSSAIYSGKAFVCHAKHPLVKESKQCVLKLGKDRV